MTYTLRIEKQGVKQLKALVKFTAATSDARGKLHSFGLYTEGVTACDTYTLGIATIGTGIRWHGDPADGLSVNAKTLIQMLPADGGTVTFANGNFTVSAAGYEASGIVDDGEWMNWRQIVPADSGERHPAGFFNPVYMGRFGALADANVGKPKQPVRLNALHPVEQVKPMTVTGEDGSLFGLIMPMRIPS
jgi:hypothetical protein